jgi:hypothetical protein
MSARRPGSRPPAGSPDGGSQGPLAQFILGRLAPAPPVPPASASRRRPAARNAAGNDGARGCWPGPPDLPDWLTPPPPGDRRSGCYPERPGPAAGTTGLPPLLPNVSAPDCWPGGPTAPRR